jgi:hypothetical protein
MDWNTKDSELNHNFFMNANLICCCRSPLIELYQCLLYQKIVLRNI